MTGALPIRTPSPAKANAASRAAAELSRRRVRLPRTAQSRQSLTFAILIHRVLPRRVMADAFEGQRLRPGATIDEATLWPEPDYPKYPLLLEYAGSDRAGRGHKRSSQIYLLWRYDPANATWGELARSAAVSTEWVETMKSVALRCLADTMPSHAAGAAEAAARVLGLLEAELDPLESAERASLLGLIWEQFLGRLQREAPHVRA